MQLILAFLLLKVLDTYSERSRMSLGRGEKAHNQEDDDGVTW